MSAQVARVKARARPWRSIIALVLALCGLAAGELGRYSRHLDPPTSDILKYGGAAVFLVFGLVASFGLSGQVRDLLRPGIGAAHAGVARYALVLAGIFTVLVITLNIANVPVGQLVLGGAVTGVLLGIAAQQSLSNLFAGMVLLFARPFRVGDRVRFRAGALAGLLDGTVTDISIAYVGWRLPTASSSYPTPRPSRRAWGRSRRRSPILSLRRRPSWRTPMLRRPAARCPATAPAPAGPAAAPLPVRAPLPARARWPAMPRLPVTVRLPVTARWPATSGGAGA